MSVGAHVQRSIVDGSLVGPRQRFAAVEGRGGKVVICGVAEQPVEEAECLGKRVVQGEGHRSGTWDLACTTMMMMTAGATATTGIGRCDNHVAFTDLEEDDWIWTKTHGSIWTDSDTCDLQPMGGGGDVGASDGDARGRRRCSASERR